MTKAALYARVSTDAQQKEGTIESQLVELRKQVAVAGHELVEEYIDDGYTGTLLDRPPRARWRGKLPRARSRGRGRLRLGSRGRDAAQFLRTPCT